MEPTRTTPSTEEESVPDDSACFECDAPTGTEWREHAFTYGVGASAVELKVTLPVRTCLSCGFEFLDHEAETLQHEAICAHLGVLTPKEIEGIRKMHGMSRARFSAVTGLGEATLNRWEKAILIQNTANDRYIRLLEDPEIMRQLRGLAEPVDFGGKRGTGDDCRWRVLRVTDRSWTAPFGLRHSRSAATRRARGARRGRQGNMKQRRRSVARS